MFNKFTEELNIISELPDKPLEGAGKITVAELKAKFDLAGQKIATFANSLIDALAAGTAAANIGAQVTNGGQTTNTTVQAAITSLWNRPGVDTLVVSTVYSGTLDLFHWDSSVEGEDVAPYTQTIEISGILEDDEPLIDLVVSSDYETAVREDQEWGQIYKAAASTGSITFYAKAEPTVDLNFKARCIRK